MVLTMAFVLWGASGILWLALTFLLVLMAVRELFQMVSSIKVRSHVSVKSLCEINFLSFQMEQHTSKNVNNCLYTNIYSYLEISGGQKF